MYAGKRTKQEWRLEVRLSKRERELIMNETMAGPDLTDRLRLVLVTDSDPSFRFTRDELEELSGLMAAEANRAKSKKLERELDRLRDRIEALLEA